MFRRVLGLTTLLSVLPLSTYAQPLPDRAPIKGQIVDEDGKPIPSATIIIRQQNYGAQTAFWGAEALSDGSGRFTIPEGEEGHFLVSVEAKGYAPLPSFNFDWTTKSAPLRLGLSKLSRLRVRVLNTDGQPLAGAPVWVRLRDQNGQSPTRRTTSASGEIIVPDVAPSTYSLIVVAANGVATQRELTFSSSQKQPVEALLQQGATIRIKATDANGKPLGGASLILFPQTPDEAIRLAGANADPSENWGLIAVSGASQGLVSHDGDGVMELKHMPAGQFSARLSIPGYGTKTRELTLQNGDSIDWNADFPARQGATLSLQVRDSNGQPTANSLVALRFLPLAANGTIDEGLNAMPDMTNMAPPLPPGGGMVGETPTVPDETTGLGDMALAAMGPGSRVAMTDAQGNITLYPVRPGNYRIFASRPTDESWLRAPVAPEGAPTDIVVSLAGPNTGGVQVP